MIKNLSSKILSKLKKIPRGFYIITGVYLLVFLIMLPFREVALEDDFAYYQTVRNFLNTGVLKISDWSATTLIFQTYWGSLFSLIFGLSFKTLQFSNVFLFYFGIIAFYLTLKELKIEDNRAVIYSLLLLAFPKILLYLYSFMSDNFYLSLLLISVYFGVKALKTDKTIYAVFVSFFSALAFLTRQIGFIIGIAFFIALVFKSLYLKKPLIFQMIGSLIVVIPTVFLYQFWLKQDGNLTNAQYLYVISLLNYYEKNFLPVNYLKLRPTNDIYDEFTVRFGTYLSWIITIFSPVILFYKFVSIKKVGKSIRENKISFFLGGFVLAFALYKLTTRFIPSYVKNHIYFPSYSLLSLEIGNYKNFWEKIWSVILVLSIPFWAFIIGRIIIKFNGLILKVRKKKKRVLFVAYYLISSLILANYIYHGIVKIGVEVLNYMFFAFFWWLVAGIIFYYFWNFYLDLRPQKPVKNSLAIFFLIAAGLQFVLTVLGFFIWPEYIFPFLPFVLMALAYFSARWKFRKITSAVIVGALLLFSLFTVKTDYDRGGVQWEIAAQAVNEKLIEPNEADISSWGWIPFYYYEKSFQKRVAEVGGDKKLINQVHTWWDDQEFQFKNQRLLFIEGNCKGVVLKEREKIYKEIKAVSIFKTYKYCVILKAK